jgi:outer membrane protein OmpA-like peptidoglycan-associated protein
MKKIAILLATFALAACSKHDASGGNAAAEAGKPQEAAAAVALAPGQSITSPASAKIGMTVAGEITDDKGPSHFYRFDNPGTLRDIVKFRLENKSTTLKPDMKFYNADRSSMSEKYDGTPGASVEQPISIDPGQTIYVEVLPYGSVGKYELSALPQHAYDANEPNDDQLKPSTLKFGDTVEGSIMDDKDNDWFHVTAPSSGKVTIALENLSTTLKPDVKIYNQAKSAITEKYDGTPGAGLDFTVDLTPGQDFYVQILPYGSTGQYRLTTRAAVQAADMASALKVKGLVDLYGIYFDTDQTFVRPESATTLTEVSNLMKADPSLKLQVSGHTDNSGTKSHNVELSKGRAEAVVAALVGQYQVAANRLVAEGFGDSKPVAPNDSPANMAKNRRVELRKI